MIDRVIGNKLLPANIRKDIIERTDGIPLFVEEMTKAVLEAGSELEAMQTVAAVPSPALAVPASLHASLMARLDRLGPAKEMAQIGAAIGREFSHALLAAVVRKPEAELGSALDRLMKLVCCSGRACRRMRLICSSMPWCRTPPMARCCAASRRASCAHRRSTRKPIPEITEMPAGVAGHGIAQRLGYRAGDAIMAAAGGKAVRRASNREAIRHFRQALRSNRKAKFRD